MALKPHWVRARQELLSLTARLTSGERDVVRLADLLTAQAYAHSLGLVPSVELADARAIRTQLGSRLALFTLPPLQTDATTWREAARTARKVAAAPFDRPIATVWSQSSQVADPDRKSRGAYSTHHDLASVMVRLAIEDDPDTVILDPSAGHGALLLAAFDELRRRGWSARTAARALHGVELDAHARELCCLKLWLAASDPEVPLADIGQRVVLGNSLCASWGAGKDQLDLLAGADDHPSGRWSDWFPAIIDRGGFTVVVANPPWESLRQTIAASSHEWTERDRTRHRLGVRRPGATELLPPLYSAQGRGDRNLYKGFVELFPHLLREGGRLIALLPGAFASDLGLAPARELYFDAMAIEQWTGFENRLGYFPIDGRYKFGILAARRVPAGTQAVRLRFLGRDASEALTPDLHVTMSREGLERLGGPSRMLPEVSDEGEAAVLMSAVENGSPFFGRGSFGEIQYRREVDLSLDRKTGAFIHVSEAMERGFAPAGDGTWISREQVLVPLVEGRMVAPFDFFQKSWRRGVARKAYWSQNGELAIGQCQPQFLAPRRTFGPARLAICDVTSATNTRTMLATWVPPWPCGNTAPVLELVDVRSAMALLAVLNSMTFDWVLRRIAAGLHLNRFYLEATPLPSVTDHDLVTLAAYASRMTLDNPRHGGLAAADRLDPSRAEGDGVTVDASVVESIVARGYGLTTRDLQRVLSQDPSDRKGLWRYFAAEPNAQEVARATIEMLRVA